MREYVTETCERSLKRIFGNVDFNKRRLKILIEFAYKCPTHKVNQYGNKITCRIVQQSQNHNKSLLVVNQIENPIVSNN